MPDMTERTAITVYPVGLLRDMRNLWHLIRARRAGLTKTPLHLRIRLRQMRESWGRRSYWNGYLAEVHYPPAGLTHTRAGRGWTRHAAARDLGLQLWKDNRS